MLLLLAAATSATAQVTSDSKDIQIAKKYLQLRTRQLDSVVTVITSMSTDRMSPSAKAVYDFVTGYVVGASGGHIIQDDGVNETQRDTLNFESSPTVTAVVTDGGGKTTVSMQIPSSGITALEIASGSVGNSELAANSIDSTKVINGGLSVRDLGQHGATDNNILRWNGTQWYPSAQNLYDVVTTSQTVAYKNNQVWINTLTAAITLNLPACNLANDGVSFHIAKAGSDNYAADIEPAGSELFNDGSTTKTLYSQGTGLICTCRYRIGDSEWFFISM